MKVRVVSAADLSADLLAVWNGILRRDENLASPYFTPGYFAAAAATRPGVRVGVLEDGGEPFGFMPFERTRFGIGQPVGGRLSDFQAVIAAGRDDWCAKDLIAGCGLRMWRFDHLLCEQPQFASFHDSTCGSPALDLRGGFGSYHARRRDAGSTHIEGVKRKTRMLARQGNISFEFDARDPQVLEQVIHWKRHQCRRTGVVDFFAERRNVDLVHTILDTRTEDFAGVLSVLRVGRRLAAAHFGMRTRRTLHYWFPVYESDLSRCSPGAVLLIELARAAAERGMHTLDLGRGDDEYKRHFATHRTPIAEGSVVVSPALAVLRRWHRSGMAFLRSSRVTAPLREPLRALRHRLRRHRIPKTLGPMAPAAPRTPARFGGSVTP
ncbi:MAG TPA: GNAT family N-acetyltransferase [Planctomycetota bacterium]